MENQKPYPTLNARWAYRHVNLADAGEWAAQAWRTARLPLLLLAVFAAFLTVVQFATPNLPDNDGFYHIKLAYLMRTEGLKPAFPWLPLSILNAREYYDHHFLFHVALIPFTFGDLRIGAKLAAVVFASLAFLSVWRLLKNQQIPYASLWALGLTAVSEAFIFRMSITRAQSLSLLVLMLALDALLRRKHRTLAVLAFAYVWLYDAFPLLVVIAGLYTLVTWFYERRLDARPLLYTSLGIAAGLVFNPYFPHDILFAAQHILPKLGGGTSVSVGNEWFPYETAQLLKNSPLALALFFSGTLGLGLSGKRMEPRTALSFLLAGLFGIMLLQSRRFIEYFPAFGLVFAAFAWTPVIEDIRIRAAGAGRTILERTIASLRPILPGLVLGLVLIPFSWVTLRQAQASLQTSKPYTLYAGASAWLQANTPPGERIFQTDWDDFPRLFYYNTHNTYLIGLDPTYMLLYDKALYERWVSITRGEVEHPARAIRDEFGARYILTDLRHTAFIHQAGADPGLAEVYRDGGAIVYQVRTAE